MQKIYKSKKILKFLILLIFFKSNSRHDEIIRVKFNKSMEANYAHNFGFARICPQWQLLQNLFDKHIYYKQKRTESDPIPNLIHFIWLGSPLPERSKRLIESWRKHHPNWQIKIWTDNDVASYKMRNKALFDKAVNWGQKSDIWRIEILYDMGGLYVDTDFLCLKSFKILHETCDFYIGIGHAPFAFLYNGLIGSKPGHPILKRAIETINLTGSLTDHDNIQKTTGPFHITKAFLEVAPYLNDRTVAFPVTYFYPFPNSHRDWSLNKIVVESYLKRESFCVHYWACSWMKK